MPEAWEVGPHVREDPIGNVTRWQAVAFSDTVKRTCSKCNNGWMHELEIKCQAIVRALIYGAEMSLDMEQARTLAFWLAKTFMMLSLAHRGPIIPTAHFHELYAAQAAPRQCLLSIGLTDTWRQEIIDIHRPLRLPSLTPTGTPSNAYGISMRIGKFVAHAIGHSVRNATIYPEVSLPGVMSEIWPSVRPITWPPAVMIADADSDLVVRMFPEA